MAARRQIVDDRLYAHFVTFSEKKRGRRTGDITDLSERRAGKMSNVPFSSPYEREPLIDFPAMDVFVILLVMVGLVVAVCAIIDMATRHRRYPNWFEATRTFSVPSKNQVKMGWRNCYYRERPGCSLMDRRIAVAMTGLIVQDRSPFVFPRPRTILIPWSSLANPRQIMIPLHYLRLRRKALELEVKDTEMTVVVSKDIWSNIRANIVAGGTAGGTGSRTGATRELNSRQR